MAIIISAQEAANLIQDRQTVCVGGFVGLGTPDEILAAIETRFVETSHPAELSVMNCAGCGDKKDRGMNRFGRVGMVRKVYCGHIGLAPKLGQLIADNLIQGYCVPQGVSVHMLRAIAGRKPGVFTHVGLKTFADPRAEGCRMNAISQEQVVELVNFDGREYLRYKPFPVDVAIIRGTTADTKGNITLEKEAAFLEQLLMAQAARNSGGIVIAQVERIAEFGSLHPQLVKLPGVMVDYIVKGSPENHRQAYCSEEYNPSWSGEVRVPLDELTSIPLDDRKVCARRAAMELRAGNLVNLGIGVPEGVASVAAEEKFFDRLTLSIESGTIGGIPAGGLGIGATTNPEAIIDQAYQFDYYDGGGIDLACLGLAQTDALGNVNVSKFAGKVVGPGGFINITQNSKTVIFCGSFTAGGFEVEVGSGSLRILKEGRQKKFVETTEQVTFSGDYARESGQRVLYVTERAVFELGQQGLVLTEIAPGVDLHKDILALMEFRPAISTELKLMDRRIFMAQPMGLTI